MAPGRKRGARGAKTKSELSLGDLVLAKVKGFPAWPAKISRPEDWERTPDPKKYFVQFFGTSEIAFVAPADIQAFTSEAKVKLSARCQGKTVKYFAQAVKEICEEFEESQLKNLSNDEGTQNLASESNSLDPVGDEALEVGGSDGINMEGLNFKREIKVMSDIPVQEFSQRQGEMECQDVKPCSSDNVKHSPSPSSSMLKKSKLSSNPSIQVNSVASPSHPCHLVEEGFRDIKVEGRHSEGGQNNLTNGHQMKLVKGSKKNSEGPVHRNSGSSISHVQSGNVLHKKVTSSGNIKVSSADTSTSAVDVGSERKEIKLLKQKKHSKATDDSQVDADLNMEEHMDSLFRKKMKAQHDHEKQFLLTTVASSPAKMSKYADSGDNAGIERVQRKNNSRSHNVVDDKTTDVESKVSVLDGKADNCRPFRVQATANESNHSTDEDELPPTKRHRRALRAMSGSALTSENKLGSFVSRNNDLVSPNKVRSPVMQLPTKRRAVLRCDDDEDELPKTPIHGGFTNKASATYSVSNSKKKPVMAYVLDKSVLRNSGTVDDDLKEQVQSSQVSNKASSPTAQQVVETTKELSAARVSPSLSQLDSEKLLPLEAKPMSVSPKMALQSTTGIRASTELQNKQSIKAPVNICQKKASAGANKLLTTVSERSTSSLNQSISERSKSAASSGEKMKSPKSSSQVIDPVLMVRNPDENINSLGDRLDAGKNEKRSFSVDLKPPDSSLSMKHLIAAAQARKREAHILNAYGNALPFSVPEADMPRQRTSPAPATLAFESSNMFQLEVQGLHPTSPSSDVCRLSSVNQHETEEFEERRVSSGHQATGSSLSGGTEAAVARDAFEGMIETLSRTKESIGRATRLAIDCAKYGIANEVVELLIRKLESEPSFHRRVDLFFLVDSITQCSHGQKGIAGASYIPIVQAALPRLIGAAAPPGASAQENRRQCHKVLRLWLERKIFPEYVLRRYMDDVGVANSEASAGYSFRRPSRAERAIDDPIREMEGMFVDEYGSNASFQLPGLLSSRIFEEEEDEDDFPTNLCNGVAGASPSKQTPAASRDPENYSVTPSDRRHCILEDVDGELEMEDVSGHPKDERPFPINGTFEHEPNSDGTLESASNIYAELFPSPEGSPPLPPGSPPVTPPLPSSPPPPPPPLSFPSQPPPPPTPLSQPHQFPPPPAGAPPPPAGPPPPPAGPPPPPAGPPPPPAGPPPLAGPPPPPAGPPPPFLPHQSLHPQPACMFQNTTPLPSTIATSPPPSYQPPAFVHEVGGTLSGNQRNPIVPPNQGSHFAASGRSEVLSQQSSCFPPAGVGSVREQIGYVPSRPEEYGQGDGYMNPQASQHRHPFLPGGAPFAQRPLHPDPPSQHAPSHFSYPTSVQQHQYSSYSLPSFSDGSRRNAADEPWRMQVNEFSADCPRGGWMEGGSSGQPYSLEGYLGLPTERPPPNTVMFQPSAPNNLPAATIPVHGAQMMTCRPDMSSINWRPP